LIKTTTFGAPNSNYRAQVCDEVITLRVTYGGAQTKYPINPDLTAMGKMIGGGSMFRLHMKLPQNALNSHEH